MSHTLREKHSKPYNKIGRHLFFYHIYAEISATAKTVIIIITYCNVLPCVKINNDDDDDSSI